MKFARPFDAFKLLFDPSDAFSDHATVGFKLRFAGTAEEAEAAALPLKVGPGTHQPATLVVEMCELDLQAAFTRARAATEDFEDQAGAVEHLGAPGALKVALLHR